LFGVQFAVAIAVDLERRVIAIAVLGGTPQSAAHLVNCSDELQYVL